MLESPLDSVAVRAVGESTDRHKSSSREICLNQVGAVLRGGRDAAERKPHRLDKRGFSTSTRPDDAGETLGNGDAQTRQKSAADFNLLNDPHVLSIWQLELGGTAPHGSCGSIAFLLYTKVQLVPVQIGGG